MSVSEKFSAFCGNLRMSGDTVAKISLRYHAITKRLNSDFRGIDSDTLNSLYVGSYGRGTAIHVSDVDMVYILPNAIYWKYNEYSTNGQSALLQTVKQSIAKTYSTTELGGDGQVVKVRFADGVVFEVVPGFQGEDGKIIFPNSNDGGRWQKTNPRPEIEAMNNLNNSTNKNLKRLCRMIRAWKDNCNVSMSGLLIDTLAYRFLSSWTYRDKSYLYYDFMTRDFFEFLSNEDDRKSYWLAVGSNQFIFPKGIFSAKAKKAYQNAVDAISYEKKQMESCADYYWRAIYGNRF